MSSKKRKEHISNKSLVIRNTKCICPGCGHDFSFCDDIALDLIFHKCHFHSSKCIKYKNGGTFWACASCNRKQRNICGYWEQPGKLFKLCINIQKVDFSQNSIVEFIRTEDNIFMGFWKIKKICKDGTVNLFKYKNNNLTDLKRIFKVSQRDLRLVKE